VSLTRRNDQLEKTHKDTGRRRTRNEEEQILSEELEENGAEEDGISNRLIHFSFILPLTVTATAVKRGV